MLQKRTHHHYGELFLVVRPSKAIQRCGDGEQHRASSAMCTRPADADAFAAAAVFMDCTALSFQNRVEQRYADNHRRERLCTHARP